MIHTVNWKMCYFKSQSTAYFNLYTQTPCSIVLISDCCNQHLVTNVKSMLGKCTPEFKKMHVLDVHTSTCLTDLQTILRSNPYINWVLVVDSYSELDAFLEEEEQWHLQAREKIEPNQPV